MPSLSDRTIHQHRCFLDNVTELGLVRDSNPLVEYNFHSMEDGRVNRLTWSDKANLSYLFGDFFTVEQYIQVLEKRDYTILFLDGALLQVDYTIVGDDVKKHRLCYLPSPIDYEPGNLYEMTVDEYIGCLSASEIMKSVRLVTPVRFDFDGKFRDEKHEHSHLTINKSSCRVPGYGAVSLPHFFKFIVRYFYEDFFSKPRLWEGIEPIVYKRTLDAHSHEFHFESAVMR